MTHSINPQGLKDSALKINAFGNTIKIFDSLDEPHATD